MSDLRESIGDGTGSDGAESADTSDPDPDPEAVLGRVPTETGLRKELAAAARSLGRESSVRSELVELGDAIAAIEVDPVDLDAARRRVANASGEEAELKERVAALRGNVRARRAVEAETDETLGDLEAAAAELSSVQTQRIAAEQALERARERAARVRDKRERRLELRDRLQNRRRDARRELANGIYPAFRNALTAIPGGDPVDAGSEPSEYEGSMITASLATIRLADLDGPVVLGETAAARLGERDRITPESVLGVEVVCRPRS